MNLKSDYAECKATDIGIYSPEGVAVFSNLAAEGMCGICLLSRGRPWVILLCPPHTLGQMVTRNGAGCPPTADAVIPRDHTRGATGERERERERMRVPAKEGRGSHWALV